MSLLGDRFILERQIGSGGMSTVYLGRDRVLDRLVAVKVLKAGFDDTDISARFRREGRTAARLAHPNIVQVYDAGEDELNGREVSYIVMEYVPGGDLKQLIDERGRIEERQLAQLGAEVSSGLVHAHRKDVVHRDIKPHNILMDDYSHPKLTDFGIARALNATHATRTGSYLGTALYSSPEQLKGEKATPKSDVYSLGVVLYQAAVGRPPFEGNPIEVASQHNSKEPLPPRNAGAKIGAQIEALILACLEKDPENRPDAAEVGERLRGEITAGSGKAFAAPPIEDLPDDGATRIVRRPPVPRKSGANEERAGGLIFRRGRNRAAMLIAAALVLFLAGLGGAFAFFGGGEESGNTEQQPQQEQSEEGGSQQPAAQETRPPEEQPGRPLGGEPAAGSGGRAEEGSAENSGEGSGDPADQSAAQQAVIDHYVAAATGDYEQVWSLISDRYKPKLGTQESYTNQFDPLGGVFFEDMSAEVRGDKATVRANTRAELGSETRFNEGEWQLVREDGQWRIDNIKVKTVRIQ